MSNPEWDEVNEALQGLTDALDYGYIIGGRTWECSQCGAKSSQPERVVHKDGCIAIPMDKLVRSLQRLRDDERTKLHAAKVLIDDILSTYRNDGKTTLVTAERQEMWIRERSLL